MSASTIRSLNMSFGVGGLDDVTITSAAQYDHLEYNGSAWVNTNDIALADTTAASTGVVYKATDRFLHNFHNPTGGGAVPDGDNVFVGVDAGNFTTGSTATQTYHGSYNTGVGVDSLQTLTTGYRNTAVGAKSLLEITTGYSNIAVGRGAGQFVTGGSTENQTSNTSVYLGDLTKASADGNANEIVIGYDVTGKGSNTATYGNSDMAAHHFTGNIVIEDTTASDQGAIIKGSARFLHNFHHPTGDSAVPVGRNLFIGELAGNFTVGSTATSTSHGSYNTGIGRESLEALTRGIANTGVGHSTLTANTSGDYNTAIGNSAGGTITTGYYNTYIGASATASAVDAVNEMAIGYNVTGNGNNTITIGGTNHTKTYIFGQLYLEAETAAADSTTPTLISLPTGGTAAQAGWLKVDIAGTESYIPFWQ